MFQWPSSKLLRQNPCVEYTRSTGINATLRTGTRKVHNSVMNNSNLWDRIEEAFFAAQLRTQVEMAKACDVRQTTVSKWKLGETVPNLRNMIDISKCTRYEVQWLYTGMGRKLVVGTNTTEEILLSLLASRKEDDKKEVLEFAKFRFCKGNPGT